MKRRIILVALSIACISTSCTTINSTDYVPPKVSYDLTIAMASLDGFRIQMSARMAKLIAEEQGYKIDSSVSKITFDDVVNGELRDFNIGDDIHLKRDYETVDLSFAYGKLCSVTHGHMFSQRQQAEELLESYLTTYPELTLSNETERFKSYKYEPNKFANIVVSTQILLGKVHNVRISISDFNYAQRKRNQEYYEEIEAIRRRY